MQFLNDTTDYYGRYIPVTDRPIIGAPATDADPIPLEVRNTPNSVCSAFGKFFYAVGNYVYFSQSLLNKEDAGRCYQNNDPTSDDISDLLDTDGGVIPIEEAGDIQTITKFYNGIAVFSTNGVWHIKGGQSGFKATEFMVTKIAQEPTISPKSVVAVKNTLFYWGTEGIFTLTPNEYGELKSEDITEESIKTYYNEIGSKSSAVGNYSQSENRIYWCISGTDNAVDKTFMLVLDLNTGGFYPQLCFGRYDHMLDLKALGLEVTFFKEIVAGSSLEVRYYSMFDRAFEDDGTPIEEAYLLTGLETLGKFSHKKGISSGVFYFNKTETQFTGFDGTNYTFDYPSSCNFQVRWDFDSSNAYKRWVGKDGDGVGSGKRINLYNPMQRGFIPPTDSYPVAFDTGEGVIKKKVKLRGHGDAVQFLFTAEEGKDLQLLGYSVEYTMGSRQ